uniref:Glutathione S-transferase P n=1 Tax=Geotrypetes seraphini TaxID=260995 RepID=A0A6P8NIE0_GEOSA|nr:glutathione S-transferase P 1-like [Geotrypetes seraphini]
MNQHPAAHLSSPNFPRHVLWQRIPELNYSLSEKGCAEATRLLLGDRGAEWKEEVVPLQKWFAGEVNLKKTAVFGQIPQFKDGDFVLYQSNTILRYLGRKYDLYGSNIKEAAVIDMVNDGVEDLRKKYASVVYFHHEPGPEKYIEELPTHLSPFERLLSQNSKGSGFIAGNKHILANKRTQQKLG